MKIEDFFVRYTNNEQMEQIVHVKGEVISFKKDFYVMDYSNESIEVEVYNSNYEEQFPAYLTELPDSINFTYCEHSFSCECEYLTSLKNFPTYTDGTVRILSPDVKEWGKLIACTELSFTALPEPSFEQLSLLIEHKTKLITEQKSPWIFTVKLLTNQMPLEKIKELPNFFEIAAYYHTYTNRNLVNNQFDINVNNQINLDITS